MENIYQEMAANWGSPVVSRTEIERFTGGIMSEKYQANLDSAGLGPVGRFRIGRKICYPVKNYVTWLESRASKVMGRHPAAE